VLPTGVDAHVQLGSWPMPPLFRLVEELTPAMSVEERYRTLNMGVGMVLVVDPAEVDAVREAVADELWTIGELAAANDPTAAPRVHLRR
jgi:phosphoribosylaminoimidazole (AIR) synthetase